MSREAQTPHREAAARDLAREGGGDAAIEIVDYDPSWPVSYEAERERLEPLLGGGCLHHFGSTAVPGLAAKPVIDMIALVRDLGAQLGNQRRLLNNKRLQFLP